jgi:hypothetical protein
VLAVLVRSTQAVLQPLLPRRTSHRFVFDAVGMAGVDVALVKMTGFDQTPGELDRAREWSGA